MLCVKVAVLVDCTVVTVAMDWTVEVAATVAEIVEVDDLVY